MKIYAKFGQNVADIRGTLGWTQDKLARKFGLSRTSIANIEAGRQRILLHDVATFAKALNVISWLLIYECFK